MRLIFLFVALLHCVGCATSNKWKSADILFDPANKATAKLLAMCAEEDVERIEAFVLVRNSSAAKVKPYLKPIPSDSKISKRYCPTIFPFQQSLFNGSIRNVYLADRRVQAIEDVSFSSQGALLEDARCFLITGTAVEYAAPAK